MVWCGLSSNGPPAPCVFDRTVSSSTHRKMLVDYAWPQLQGKRLYFQHNGAAPHCAAIVLERLDEKFPGHWIGKRGPFDWSTRSPDLNTMRFFSLGISKGYCIQRNLYLNYAA